MCNERLNPYCAGRCSSTVQEFIDKHKLNGVSILIVLDDALVRKIMNFNKKNFASQSLLCWTML